MSILLQKKNVGSYSYMSSPNIYYRAIKKPYPHLETDVDMAFVTMRLIML